MKIKKIIIGILLVLAIVLVAGYYYINWVFNQPCPPPEKPSVVPERAVWKGGCDGGHWVELIDIKEGKSRFRIYLDWNGELLLDADFSLSGCDNIVLSSSNWNELVSWFSGENLEIKNLSEQKGWKCRLVPIYPAYGGSQWDVIKEKEEY